MPVAICFCKCNKPHFVTRHGERTRGQKGSAWTSCYLSVFSTLSLSLSLSEGSWTSVHYPTFSLPTAGVMGIVNHYIWTLTSLPVPPLFLSLQTVLCSQRIWAGMSLKGHLSKNWDFSLISYALVLLILFDFLFKRVIGCKIPFKSYLNINVCWKCVYTSTHNDKNPPSVFFFKSLF